MKPWHVALVFALVAIGTGVLVAHEAVPGAVAGQWLTDPVEASRKAGATAKELEGLSVGAWAAIFTGALTILGLAKKYAPLISKIVPVWGPFIEMAANVGWHLASTKDQKIAEQEAQRVVEATSRVAPVLEILLALPIERVPTELLSYLASPTTKDALATIARKKTP